MRHHDGCFQAHINFDGRPRAIACARICHTREQTLRLRLGSGGMPFVNRNEPFAWVMLPGNTTVLVQDESRLVRLPQTTSIAKHTLGNR